MNLKLIDILNEDLFGSSNKMKPHEKLIVNAVVGFMKRKYGIRSKIIVKKKETKGMLGDVVLSDNAMGKDKFYLHFNPDQSYPMIIQSLIHELIHIKQVSMGELKPSSDFRHIMWRGKEFISVKEYLRMGKTDFASYKELPWEKEAYTSMRSLYNPFLQSNEWKDIYGKDTTLDFIIKNI
jgi:hypothetical protein